jgi:Spy/CpxP family protein refolding chaperone
MTPEVRQKAAFWLMLVFVLGLATGGVFGYSFAHKSYAANRAPYQQMSDAEKRAKKVSEMTEAVGLTQEQAQKVEAIISATQTQIKSVHEKNDADITALRMNAREQMRAFLTPEQLPKFEEFVHKIDVERQKQQAMQGK